MKIIENFFENRFRTIIDYFKRTPTFILIQTIIGTVGTFSIALGYVSCIIEQNPYILIYAMAIVICLMIIDLFYIDHHSINIDDIYFEKDSFLINMITNILEVKRIKASENINPVKINELVVNYHIEEPIIKDDVLTSNLNVSWEIIGVTSNQALEKYDMIYCKNNSGRKPSPVISVEKFGIDSCEAIISHTNTGVLNRFCANLTSANISSDTGFKIKISLSNYYNFIWNECEILILNPNIYGDSVNHIKIKLNFLSEDTDKKNISIYEVNQKTLKENGFNICVIQKRVMLTSLRVKACLIRLF